MFLDMPPHGHQEVVKVFVMQIWRHRVMAVHTALLYFGSFPLPSSCSKQREAHMHVGSRSALPAAHDHEK